VNSILNESAFFEALLRREPFEWALAHDVYFKGEVANCLEREFPWEILHERNQRKPKGKQYEMLTETLVDRGHMTKAVEGLSTLWRVFLRDLTTEKFLWSISDLTGRDLSDAALEVRVSAYKSGGFFSAHTDRPDKLVTVIFYFEREWCSDLGGELLLLRSKNEDEVVFRVPPLLGTAAVLVRSEQSWHAVARVCPEIDLCRRSVLVHFSTRASEEL